MKFTNYKKNIMCTVLWIIIALIPYIIIKEQYKYFLMFIVLVCGGALTEVFTYRNENRTLKFGIFRLKRSIGFEEIKYFEQVFKTREDLNRNNQKKCDTFICYDDNKVHKIDNECMNIKHGRLSKYLMDNVNVPVKKVLIEEK